VLTTLDGGRRKEVAWSHVSSLFKKKNIKLRKIDKNKRKMFKSKCTITIPPSQGFIFGGT